MISRVITLFDSNVQFSTKKNHKAYKETEKYSLFKGKTLNQQKPSLQKT